MPELVQVLAGDDISRSIAGVAEKINRDYQGRNLVLIGVLKGAFIFLADLLRRLTVPVQVDFLRASSYISGTSSSGEIRLTKEIELDVAEKDVLIVEDIVDTGHTLEYLITYIESFHPASVGVCALISKHERRQKDVDIDYVCHEISEGYLVGFGLDYNERYRNLPGVYQLKL